MCVCRTVRSARIFAVIENNANDKWDYICVRYNCLYLVYLVSECKSDETHSNMKVSSVHGGL